MQPRTSSTTAVGRVFVSYNRHDRQAVECIVKQLQSGGLAVWFDHWSLAPGDQWQSAIESALHACDTCAVFVGPHGAGPWQHEEMRSAIHRRVTSPGFRVIPAFLPGAPEEPDGLSDFLLAGHSVHFKSLEDTEAIRLLISGVQGTAPGSPSPEPSARIVYEVVITGSIQAIDKSKIEAIFEHLRKLTKDASLTLKAVKDGSVIFLVEGNSVGFDTLTETLSRGPLDTIGGELILQVRRSHEEPRTTASPEASDTRPIVFVVDSDVSVQESLGLSIRAAGWRPKVFSSAEEFLSYHRPSVASCLILEVQLPGLNGLELQQQLADTDVPIVFLTGQDDVPTSVQAMRSGAIDFLVKPFHENVLLQAINAALEGSRASLRDDSQLQALRDRVASLTRLEREVMALVVSGALNKQVGVQLGISEMTAKRHRFRVMRKLNASSVADLVRMAVRLGLESVAKDT